MLGGLKLAVGLMRGAFSRAGRVPVPGFPVWLQQVELMLDEQTLDYPAAYQKLPDIYAAVSIIQDAIAAVPLRFYEVSANGEETELEDGQNAVVDLFRGGSSQETGYDLIHSLVGHFCIGGNGYIFLDYEDVNPFNARSANERLLPSALWALPSHLIQPVLGKNRRIEKYQYWTGGSTPQDIPVEQIIHVPDFNTDPSGKGMSRLYALSLTYHSQHDMERLTREMFKRGGMTAGVYSTDQPLPTEERARIKEDLRVEGEGPENYFKPVILPRGLRWVRSGLTPGEMAFIEMSDLTTTKIARVYKLPPSFMGMRVGGLGGSDKGLEADMMLLIRHALQPITRRFEARINEFLFKRLFKMPNIRMRFDYSAEYALQQVFINQATAFTAAVGRPVISVNEARKRIGIAPTGVSEDDDLMNPQPQQEPAVGGNAPASDAQKQSITRVLGSDDMAMMHRRVAESELRVWVETTKSGVERVLKRQRKRVLSGMAAKRAATIDIDELVGLLESNRDSAAVRRMLADIFREVGAAAAAEVAEEVSFRLSASRARSWLKMASLDAITNINRTTRDALRASLAEGIGQSEPLTSLVERVNDVFGDRIARSTVIATTESHAAMNAARLEGWRQAEEQTGRVVKKRWLTSKDVAVRGNPDGPYKNAEFSHYHADGQSVPLDQPFFVGDRDRGNGEACDAPGDPKLSAGNRINCRCAMVVDVEEALPEEISQKSLAQSASLMEILSR